MPNDSASEFGPDCVERDVSNTVPLPASMLPEAFSTNEDVKGGEGGELPLIIPDPTVGEAPPLPPLPAPLKENVAFTPPPFTADGIFFPAPNEDPVVAALKGQGLYGGAYDGGTHELVCPWQHEHPNGTSAASAIYSEPDTYNAVGRFYCPAQHEGPKSIKDLLDRLEVRSEQARCKALIRIQAGEINAGLAAAEHVLALMGRFYQSNGNIVTIRQRQDDLAIELANEQVLTKALAAAADWEKWDGRAKDYIRSDPPVRLVHMLGKGHDCTQLPRLEGVARQPFFRPGSGHLVEVPGYDVASGFFAAFVPETFTVSRFTREQAEAALKVLSDLLREFHFADEVDRSATLCAMLTAAVRASVPLAPAFNLTATAPGSGKSYLARLVTALSGPGEPMTMGYPASSEEASKAMLAAFLKEPAAVLFDDMQNDWLPFGVMNRLLTSETISERLLGSNRVVTARTKTFIIGTGNNISPVRDMCRRVVTIRLAPPSSAPATLRYKGRPVERVLENRGRYVGLALTIVGAWLASSEAAANVPPIGSFERWSEMCRQPLIWLGLPDPADSLLHQLRHDPDLTALSDLLKAWKAEFGYQPVPLRKVIKTATDDMDGGLYEALMALPITDRGYINHSKFGWYLKKNAGRIADGYVIERVNSRERLAWKVDMVEDRAEV